MSRAQRRDPRRRQLARTRNRHPAWIRWTVYAAMVAILVVLFLGLLVHLGDQPPAPTRGPAFR